MKPKVLRAPSVENRAFMSAHISLCYIDIIAFDWYQSQFIQTILKIRIDFVQKIIMFVCV